MQPQCRLFWPNLSCLLIVFYKSWKWSSSVKIILKKLNYQNLVFATKLFFCNNPTSNWKSHWLFVKGMRAVLTSRLGSKNTSSTLYWSKMSVRKQISSFFPALLLFCLSHFAPSSVPFSRSPLQSASSNAFRSNLEEGQHLHWLNTLFVLVDPQNLSPLVFLCGLSFSLVFLFRNSQIEKQHFLNLIVVLVVDLLLQWEYFTWDQMEEKYLLHQYSSRQTETKTL